MVILRESRGLFGDLCLYVVGQRFDICPAVLVFQDAFYRPGSCHSHTLSELSHRAASTISIPLIILMLCFLRLGYQKPGSVLNMLPVITQCASMKSGETRAGSYVQPQSSMSALRLFTDWRGNSTPRGSASAHKTSRDIRT